MSQSLRLQGKDIVFFLVDGFDGGSYDELSNCLQARGANLTIASFLEGDLLRSEDGKFELRSDLSFAEASGQYYDAVVVSDGQVARAIGEHAQALQLIEQTWGRGSAVVTVGAGALALIAAGIVDGARVASVSELYEHLENAGAEVAGTPVSVSGNILTAGLDADLMVLCADLADYLTAGTSAAA